MAAAAVLGIRDDLLEFPFIPLAFRIEVLVVNGQIVERHDGQDELRGVRPAAADILALERAGASKVVSTGEARA